MPSFRCQYLDKWLHKGQISQEEYDKAIKKLDGHDRQIIEDTIDSLVKLVCEYYTMQERTGCYADINLMIKQRIADFGEQLKEQKND